MSVTPTLSGIAMPFGDTSALNPSSSRLSSLNIPATVSPTPVVTLSGSPLNDKRVRISMLPNSPAIFYKDKGNPLLYNYLGSTNGVLFPYQPKVDISYSANYQAQKVVQSNFTFYSYENSEIKPFEISCDFPVRNQYEGRYVIAAIMFLRSLTMMFTGNDNKYAGSPPLVVSLQGMGFSGLDYVPIAITNITTSYPDNVDYVSITIPGVSAVATELIKVPTLMSISVSCTPIFSRKFASQFSALKFSAGLQRLYGPAVSSTSTARPAASASTSGTSNNDFGILGVDNGPTTLNNNFGILGIGS